MIGKYKTKSYLEKYENMVSNKAFVPLRVITGPLTVCLMVSISDIASSYNLHNILLNFYKTLSINNTLLRNILFQLIYKLIHISP